MFLNPILIIDPDGMNAQRWEFDLDQLTIQLRRYEILTRSSPRHKWRVTKFYDRIMKRDVTIEKDEVLLPSKVTKEILKQVFERVTVKK